MKTILIIHERFCTILLIRTLLVGDVGNMHDMPHRHGMWGNVAGDRSLVGKNVRYYPYTTHKPPFKTQQLTNLHYFAIFFQ
jgi:hypothetical protein